jgi:hypothetical protein
MPARAEPPKAPREPDARTPPPDGPEGHNGLKDAADEATRAIEERKDGGTSGFGDIG